MNPDEDIVVCMNCGLRIEQVGQIWRHLPVDGSGRHFTYCTINPGIRMSRQPRATP